MAKLISFAFIVAVAFVLSTFKLTFGQAAFVFALISILTSCTMNLQLRPSIEDVRDEFLAMNLYTTVLSLAVSIVIFVWTKLP